jgi:hypothetical protein
MRVWSRSGITAFGQKTPILVAYRRLSKWRKSDIAIVIAALFLSPTLPLQFLICVLVLDGCCFTIEIRQDDCCVLTTGDHL